MKYRTIVVDPPWPYPEGFADGGTNHHLEGQRRDTSLRPAINHTKPLPYHSMELAEIAALPVSDLAERDARLFLWSTNRYLPAAIRLFDRWEFVYRQTLVWDKTPNVNPLGGSVAPNSTEFLLVAIRGNPARIDKWHTSVIQARKPRSTHSRKPDVFLDLVEAVSPGPYLELFARRNRIGWDTWGNEALEHVEVVA